MAHPQRLWLAEASLALSLGSHVNRESSPASFLALQNDPHLPPMPNDFPLLGEERSCSSVVHHKRRSFKACLQGVPPAGERCQQGFHDHSTKFAVIDDGKK